MRSPARSFGSVVLVASFAAGCATAAPEQPVDAKLPIDAAPQRDMAVDTPPANLCATTDTCQAAMVLGTVSGDTGAQTLSASGSKAAWFRFRVTENDNSGFGTAMSAEVKLTSPSAGAFQVIVYVNPGNDVVECTNVFGTVDHNGTIDDTIPTWGEGTIANGSNDGRDVSVEVRPMGTSCDAAQMWQLQIIGNQ